MTSAPRTRAQLLAKQAALALVFVLLLTVGVGRVGRADSAQGYYIHGSDQLNVVVFGDTSLSGPQTVLPNGDITLPLVGAVRVGGKTPDQAARTIERALAKYVRHPVVTVSVTQEGQLNVLVLGGVKNPGKYQMAPASHLTDAIAAAGGLGPTDGPFPDARVAAPNGAAAQVSLQKLLHEGDTTIDVSMQQGTIVYIPAPQTITVEVVGSVDHPGEIVLNEGDHLSMAIAKAGNGPSTFADLNHVRVTRTLPDGKPQVISINLYDKLEKGDLSSDLVMQKGDLVYVPQGKVRDPQRVSAAASLLATLRLLFLHF